MYLSSCKEAIYTLKYFVLRNIATTVIIKINYIQLGLVSIVLAG